MDPSRIKEKIGRFRILVIGRANAGKTTILQRVCNTRENPEIYNSAGKKIDPTVLMASTERGEHDIENEMVFRNNPGFVFHDSRGFEAGGESEFDKMKAFIASRSKETKLKNQLHAIWYCIPMDEASRSFTEGEIKFFSQCDTGSIAVMVLFTKFDALYDVAYAQLKSMGKSMEEAEELAPKHAEESFAIGSQLKFLYCSKDIRRPPKCHICLPILQKLFISTQQTNLELCMKYAVERTLADVFDTAKTKASEAHEKIIWKMSGWFPHILPDYLLLRRRYRLVRDLDQDLRDLDRVDFLDREDLLGSHRTEMRSRLLSVTSGSSPLENILQLSSAVVIIFEHSYFIFDKRRYLQNQPKSGPSFYAALEQYTASLHAAAVREGVSAAVQAYEEAMKTAVYGSLPAWTAKLRFKRSQEKQAKADLIKTILEITLNHRLPRP